MRLCANGLNTDNIKQLVGVAGLSALAAPVAEAAIVLSVTIVPDLAVPGFFSAGQGWDIDGDGIADFRLGRFALGAQVIASGENLGDPVKPAGVFGLQRLNSGATIGETLQPAHDFFNPPVAVRLIDLNGGLHPETVAAGWAFGETGFFGFRFNIGSDTHYGWSELSMDPDTVPPADRTFRITQTWYNDVAGDSIRAGQTIPKPVEFSFGPGAPALGAAGLRRCHQQAAAQRSWVFRKI